MGGLLALANQILSWGVAVFTLAFVLALASNLLDFHHRASYGWILTLGILGTLWTSASIIVSTLLG